MADGRGLEMAVDTMPALAARGGLEWVALEKT